MSHDGCSAINDPSKTNGTREPPSGLKRPNLRQFLQAGNPLILDGASGTWLEDRGIPLHPRLWASIAGITHPEVVKQLYQTYFEAGANIVTTVTYQASVDMLDREFGSGASSSITQMVVDAVTIAQQPTPEANKFVAASSGPYGAYLGEFKEYSGDYGQTTLAELREFHRAKTQLLEAGDPDALIFETVPSLVEIQAICSVIDDLEILRPVFLSLSVKIDNEGGEVRLADGHPLIAVPAVLSPRITAIGANCFPLRHAPQVIAALQIFRPRPLVVYPNAGETYNVENSAWAEDRDADRLWDAAAWVQAGVLVIGGCCRTGPDEVNLLARRLGAGIDGPPPAN